MTNRELFLAISDVVKQEVQSVKMELRTELGEEIQDVRAEVQDVRTEIRDVHTELGGKIHSLEIAVGEIRQELAEVKDDVHKINLKLENNVEPRLKAVFDVCVPAAARYTEEAKLSEELRSDMVLVKKAIEEHSMDMKEYGAAIEEHGRQLEKIAKLA